MPIDDAWSKWEANMATFTTDLQNESDAVYVIEKTQLTQFCCYRASLSNKNKRKLL